MAIMATIHTHAHAPCIHTLPHTNSHAEACGHRGSDSRPTLPTLPSSLHTPTPASPTRCRRTVDERDQTVMTVPMPRDARVAVVGGGIAGLVAAHGLAAAGMRPVVFDTGEHGVGGRLATRATSDASVRAAWLKGGGDAGRGGAEELSAAGLVFDHASQQWNSHCTRSSSRSVAGTVAGTVAVAAPAQGGSSLCRVWRVCRQAEGLEALKDPEYLEALEHRGDWEALEHWEDWEALEALEDAEYLEALEHREDWEALKDPEDLEALYELEDLQDPEAVEAPPGTRPVSICTHWPVSICRRWPTRIPVHTCRSLRLPLAAYFTVSDPEFRSMVDEWVAAGVVASWDGPVGMLKADGGGFSALPAGEKGRWVCRGGMRALAEHLAKTLEERYPQVCGVAATLECVGVEGRGARARRLDARARGASIQGTPATFTWV
eukprot:366005-Chlamydomonas_euryale.AAC.2